MKTNKSPKTQRASGSVQRMVRRLARILKWMRLMLCPPKAECPRCGETTNVHRGRTDGRTTFRCFGCLVKFDRHGNRYLWRKPPNVALSESGGDKPKI